MSLPGGDHFVFLLHEDPARFPIDWAPVGIGIRIMATFSDTYPPSFDFSCVIRTNTLPRDRFPYPEFLADLYQLPVVFCESGFLLQEEMVNCMCLAASSERLLVQVPGCFLGEAICALW